ncbi:MAG: alanine/glycine:cation symporter family protein [Alphaproteobacteria bacterium]
MRASRPAIIILLGLVAVIWGVSAFGAEGVVSLDDRINNVLGPVSDAVAGVVFYSVPFAGSDLKLIVVWLIVSAVIFTVYLRFINIWGFPHAFRVVAGRAKKEEGSDGGGGEITHFQALTAALSGTVGLGNIAGVAVAIALGGPGAAFWMTVAGFFGMASKFVECSLGLKYRVIHDDGSVSGGPMYYLSRGLAEIGLPRLGKFLAVFFALMCMGGAVGAGNMFQANQAYQQFVNATGGEASVLYNQGWLFGLIMAALVGLVIIGGIRSIAQVTERLVPLMGIVYLIAGLVVLISLADHLPWAVMHIVTEAFTPAAGFGGMVGVLIVGFQRAAFSNEAGIGSAPIAYASVRTRDPLSVGYVSLLEPFIDTIVICNLTALVIVVSGVYADGSDLNGVRLTSAAFESAISWFPYVLALAVGLFAFSTIITWSYYGLKSWAYLVGNTPFSDHLFKVMFCSFTVIGAAMSLDKVVQFSDAMIFTMAFPNVIGMYLLARHIKRDLFRPEGEGDESRRQP